MPVFDPGVPWLRGTATLTNGSTTVETDGVITLNEILEGDRLYVFDGGQRIGPFEIVGGEEAVIELRDEFEGATGSYSIAIDRNPVTPLGAKILRDMSDVLGRIGNFGELSERDQIAADLIPIGPERDAIKDALDVTKRASNLADLTNLKEARANLGTFSTVADVQSRHIPAVLESIRTEGYSTPGDGGGALYKRVASEPSHAGKIQSANGAWWELAETTITPKMLGARGDGASDDTAAFNRMFGCPQTSIYIPPGTYLVRGAHPVSPSERALQWTVDGGRLTCDGTLTTDAMTYGILEVFGDDNHIQINVEGNNRAFSGVWATGDNNRVQGCTIRNIQGTGFGAYGIRINTAKGGCLVSNNIIEGVTSDGDTSEQFSARCISVVVGEDTEKQTIVTDNLLLDCLGPPSASFHVIGSGGGPDDRLSAKVLFANNVIKGFGRRAFKCQANDVVCRNNWFTNNTTKEDADQYGSSVIDVTNGKRVSVTGNVLSGCAHYGQINAQGDSSSYSIEDLVIDGNIIEGLDDTSNRNCIFVRVAKRAIVSNNTIYCGGLSAVSVGDTEGLVVKGNTTYVSDGLSTEDVFNFTVGVVAPVISDNIFASGERLSAIRCTAPGAILKGNMLTGFTGRLFRDTNNTTRIFVYGNTLALGQAVYLGAVRDKFLGANYGSNRTMAPLFVNSSLDDLGSLVVESGQIVFKKTVSADPAYIGWVSLATGAADAISWRRIGATDYSG